MNIPRLTLIQNLIDKNKFSKYLEIGVSIGTVFFRVKCAKKIAVDPSFGFSKFKILTRTLRLGNYSNLSARYFEKTSDDFFKDDAPSVLNDTVDIALIDGMHEYGYALRDIENTLKYLSPNGVIIVHDCNPKTQENACSFHEWKERGFTGEWNGDVWKAIVNLRSSKPDLDIFVADIDQGLGIITKRNTLESPSLPNRSYEEVGNLSFEEFSKNRNEWLNLKPASFLNTYFNIDSPFI